MVFKANITTVEEFDAFVQHPDNTDKLFEYIAGVIVEVPSNPYASKISQRIAGEIYIYLKQNDIGHLTGEAGGYMVGDGRYAPDVAFISYEKQDELVKEGYNPNPPDLAVEVVSSDSSAENAHLTIKLGNYLAVDTLVWIVRSDDGYIEVHRAGKSPQIKYKDDELYGDDVLPNLRIKVSDILK